MFFSAIDNVEEIQVAQFIWEYKQGVLIIKKQIANFNKLSFYFERDKILFQMFLYYFYVFKFHFQLSISVYQTHDIVQWNSLVKLQLDHFVFKKINI